MTVLLFDEINALEKRIKQYFDDSGHVASPEARKRIIDELLDMFLLLYVDAVQDINRQFDTDIMPDAQTVQEIIYKPIDGATWEERVNAWFDSGGTIDDIMRLAETEAHRIVNTAMVDTATQAGAKSKTWVTMLDDRVRETHEYLEGVTVPIDARFYTYDGDSADAPGGFISPENNINCRCMLRFN